MFPKLSGPGLFAIFILMMLLLFGPRKLPEMSHAIGKTVTAFIKGLKD
jgi:Sec-independent protein translocase protein TatA